MRTKNFDNPEKFGLPKLWKLVSVHKKIENQKMLDEHILFTAYSSLTFSSDKNEYNKKLKYYNEIIKKFQ